MGEHMVITFCGVPGAGKTTIARRVAANLKKLGQVKVLTSDEILGSRVYQHIFRLLRENLDRVNYILIDATFYKKEWREAVKAIAGEKNVLTCYLHCPLKTCLERNRERKPSLPDRVIHIINKEMECPQNPGISIDTEKTGLEEAVGQIVERVISLRKMVF